MKLFAFCLVALLISCAVRSSVSTEFDSWAATHQKVYSNEAERNLRLEIFERNKLRYAQLRAAHPLATFGPNKFSDMTPEEFRKERLMPVRRRNATVFQGHVAPSAIGSGQVQKIDWRTKGAVTSVKDQGKCGSCYTFGTVGAIEGGWAIAGNALVNLSEQELVSCAAGLPFPSWGGCNGGEPQIVVDWLIHHQGGWITTSDAFPYASQNGPDVSPVGDLALPKCSLPKPKAAQVASYNLLPNDEMKMAEYVALFGPIAIDVNATSFNFYTTGILSNCGNEGTDHVVLAVGFDLQNDPPYWIVKNSWAADWGENGYVRILFGANECDIASLPTAVTVGAPPPLPPLPPSSQTPSGQCGTSCQQDAGCTGDATSTCTMCYQSRCVGNQCGQHCWQDEDCGRAPGCGSCVDFSCKPSLLSTSSNNKPPLLQSVSSAPSATVPTFGALMCNTTNDCSLWGVFDRANSVQQAIQITQQMCGNTCAVLATFGSAAQDSNGVSVDVAQPCIALARNVQGAFGWGAAASAGPAATKAMAQCSLAGSGCFVVHHRCVAPINAQSQVGALACGRDDGYQWCGQARFLNASFPDAGTAAFSVMQQTRAYLATYGWYDAGLHSIFTDCIALAASPSGYWFTVAEATKSALAEQQALVGCALQGTNCTVILSACTATSTDNNNNSDGTTSNGWSGLFSAHNLYFYAGGGVLLCIVIGVISMRRRRQGYTVVQAQQPLNQGDYLNSNVNTYGR